MFKTPLSAEVETTGFDVDYRNWRVCVHDSAPWFHAVMATMTEDGVRRRPLMIDDEMTFERVLRELEADQHLEHIQAVLPPWMTGAAEWKMEPLQRLAVGESKWGRSAYVYQLASGKMYLHRGADDETEQDLADLREIYIASAPAEAVLN
ncbi:hypothetical protein [Pseudomonas aeruginosa]|uniref:hypothetical protein n=1 Tax=Pseudomonas aeruginosa TaxID=287 RepID=UPI001A260AD6|nr:hypothetical protein [Pseudomonas aeruginosa]MDI3829426.1 hypothetical protein [Pseudomonas aeruginosa]HBN9565036.1 hypothetical protein [Pseudomonas aeruginosa]HBO3132166.1 hypothetical protein [Pseudomonas aeruginosa]HEH9254319.1 hypothetical protein [Pseudomonas aeruginosa]